MKKYIANDNDLPPDIQANLDHAMRLREKISKLSAALKDTGLSLEQSIRRNSLTIEQAVEIYRNTQGIPRRNEICSATGWTPGKLRYFISDCEKRERLGRSYVPPDGIHCVYVMFRHEVCVYVGRSKNMRSRIKQHEKNGNHFDYIEVYQVRTFRESQDLEAVLQQQHKPVRNRRTEKRVA